MTLVQKRVNVDEAGQITTARMGGWKRAELLGLLQQTLAQLNKVTEERDTLAAQIDAHAKAQAEQHDAEQMGKHKQYVKTGAVVTVSTKVEDDPHKKGVVKVILTNSSYHPHGIKVRLQDGSIGRVVAIHPPPLPVPLVT
jgi:uncharacterized repeat protein (TIGR03833 family)